jgi:hypothetical protein
MEDEGLQENRGKEALPDLRQVRMSQFLPASLAHNIPLHMGGASFANLVDGRNLKCTFRRYVDQRLMSMWDEMLHQ